MEEDNPLSKPTVGIIVFYFGKFPWYHHLFINSCKNNPDFTFLFFSDQFTEVGEDDNIQQHPFSLNHFNELASEKLGFEIAISQGMKLCDLRPAFGLIFEDYLTEFDFWGYSDTDIVLGKLDTFVSEKELNNYDFISVAEHFPSGFFALFRNAERTNLLFKQSKTFEDMVQRDHNTLFEECGGYYTEVMSGINILDTECQDETIHHLLERNKHEIRSLFRLLSMEDSPGSLSLHNGKLAFKGEEVMMYHLTGFKKNLFARFPKPDDKPEKYIFKFSVQDHSPWGWLKGKLYDIYCDSLMICSLKIDPILKLPPRKISFEGRYRYMQLFMQVSMEKSTPLIEYNDHTFKCYKSLLLKNLYHVQKARVYIDLADQKIPVIFPNGNKITFTKIDY